MKASIGFFDCSQSASPHPQSAIDGTFAFTGGLKAQWSLPFSMEALALSGHTAPSSIHAVSVAICAELSGPPLRGILSFGSFPLTARISRLSSALPGMIATPRSPPLSALGL